MKMPSRVSRGGFFFGELQMLIDFSSRLRGMRAMAVGFVSAALIAGVATVTRTDASQATDTALSAGEVRVNTTTALVQQSAAVARDGIGNYVVVWTTATA